MLSIRGLACVAAAFVCLMATAVSAQPFDKRTLFTFSGPVALPGVTLPAGQYLFRLADPNADPRVIQVLDAVGRKPYGMFFTLPTERPDPASKPEVRFMETASGMPAAIRTWWYPGERRGYEFIFPKEQAQRLAKGATEPVLTTQAETTTTEQTNTAELSRVGGSGQETNVSATAAPTAATPTGTAQEGQLASSSLAIATPEIPSAVTANPIASAKAEPARTARTQLPRTATQLPLIAIVGTATLFSAAAMRYLRTRKRH